MGHTPDLTKETNSSMDQLQARNALEELFKNQPLPVDQLMCNFGLYMRASVLVKYLVINDLYTRILNLPGVIMEFGCWWGQNLVLFENLRAIYEPFNKCRKVIGFDTFGGYTGFTDKDRVGEVFSEGNYAVNHNHKEYLANLLSVHEACNVLGHMRNRHSLVQGDVTNTVPEYLAKHPETIISLAYFDMGLYQPTLACLKAIKPHLISGSVILLDEFNWGESPGEAIAFREVFGTQGVKIEKSKFTAERAIITIS